MTWRGQEDKKTTYVANGGGTDALVRGFAQAFGKGDKLVAGFLERGDGVGDDDLSVGRVRINQER